MSFRADFIKVRPFFLHEIGTSTILHWNNILVLIKVVWTEHADILYYPPI